jgi:hypothetical protein
MSIKHVIWRVSPKPEELIKSVLESEQLLETMIIASPQLLSDDWMFIGQQEDTGCGGRIDLLAIAPDGGLILVELKRNRTSREVTAQALDYASWVEKLSSDQIDKIYNNFAPNRNLAQDFQKRFGHELDLETLNQNHQIIIVAAEIDASTERIIAYLNERGIPINVLCFQVFMHGADQFISRAWLHDPIDTQINAESKGTGQKEPWNGEFYANFGDAKSRSWAEAVKYGFFCAGGGAWYSNTLKLLSPGDRIWVKAPDYGFVGVERVEGFSQRASDFFIPTPQGERPILEILEQGSYHREYVDDSERSEYFIAVQWLDTLTIDKGIKGAGLFGQQNTVCRPTTPKWRKTIEHLQTVFTKYNERSGERIIGHAAPR